MIVPRGVIKDFMHPYCTHAKRYLCSAIENYPEVSGKFSIEQSCYLDRGVHAGHLTFTDFTICSNQLAYIGMANAVKSGRSPLLDYSYEFLRENQTSLYICSVQDFRMHGIIPETGFEGMLVFGKEKKLRNTCFIPASVNFENKFIGKLMFAVS